MESFFYVVKGRVVKWMKRETHVKLATKHRIYFNYALKDSLIDFFKS